MVSYVFITNRLSLVNVDILKNILYKLNIYTFALLKIVLAFSSDCPDR